MDKRGTCNGSSHEKFQPYLLTPIGQPFTWPFAQHSSKVLPDIDHNKETTNIISFR